MFQFYPFFLGDFELEVLLRLFIKSCFDEGYHVSSMFCFPLSIVLKIKVFTLSLITLILTYVYNITTFHHVLLYNDLFLIICFFLCIGDPVLERSSVPLAAIPCHSMVRLKIFHCSRFSTSQEMVTSLYE